MRAPQPTGDDIAMLAQEAAIGRKTRPQQFGVVGNFALHFRQQGVADIVVERGGIGMTCRGAGHRNAAAGAGMHADRVGGPGIFESTPFNQTAAPVEEDFGVADKAPVAAPAWEYEMAGAA